MVKGHVYDRNGMKSFEMHETLWTDIFSLYGLIIPLLSLSFLFKKYKFKEREEIVKGTSSWEQSSSVPRRSHNGNLL